MNQEDYPALYRSADASSLSAQTTYLWLIRLQYGLLIAAAVSALWFSAEPNLLVLYAILVSGSAGLLIYMAVKKPEKDWYACRALAESIKTSTWRYMMRAEPFEDVPAVSEVRRGFAEFLKGILDANKHIDEPISRKPIAGEQITIVMDTTRALPLNERREKYYKDRVEDQRNWYIAKANTNRRHFRGWVLVCVALQVGAIILVLARIRYDQQWEVWPTEPLLVAVSALIGWMQIKKYNELASAYSLTAHEIGIIQTRSDHVSSESEFSEFVNEAERAFSREHTQWMARQND